MSNAPIIILSAFLAAAFLATSGVSAYVLMENPDMVQRVYNLLGIKMKSKIKMMRRNRRQKQKNVRFFDSDAPQPAVYGQPMKGINDNIPSHAPSTYTDPYVGPTDEWDPVAIQNDLNSGFDPVGMDPALYDYETTTGDINAVKLTQQLPVSKDDLKDIDGIFNKMGNDDYVNNEPVDDNDYYGTETIRQANISGRNHGGKFHDMRGDPFSACAEAQIINNLWNDVVSNPNSLATNIPTVPVSLYRKQAPPYAYEYLY